MFHSFPNRPPQFPLKFTTVIKIEWQISNHKNLNQHQLPFSIHFSANAHRYSVYHVTQWPENL